MVHRTGQNEIRPNRTFTEQVKMRFGQNRTSAGSAKIRFCRIRIFGQTQNVNMVQLVLDPTYVGTLFLRILITVSYQFECIIHKDILNVDFGVYIQ